MSTWPSLETLPRRALPPDECCFGTSPGEDAEHEVRREHYLDGAWALCQWNAPGDGKSIFASAYGGGFTEVAPTLDASCNDGPGAMPEGSLDTVNIRAASGGSSRSNVAQPWAVRRLIPMECAQLRGFPDDHRAITYRGKPAADGPQYKALGNSGAVPCIAWITERTSESMANHQRGAA